MLEAVGKGLQTGVSASAGAIARSDSGELDQVPMDRLGLAAEGIEARMVEIGGGEMAVPEGRPAPRPVIEALAR
jgi:hypothetical protein